MQNYEATILPYSMVFKSRCRTLERLGEFDISIAETFIFGKARERLTQNLVIINLNRQIHSSENPLQLSLEQFDDHQRQFLSMAQFSQRRHFNPKQREAIHAIVSGLYQNCPYILFGPPGTGKTVTLVEAVRLIVEQNPENATILVCTPSNTAAYVFVFMQIYIYHFQVTISPLNCWQLVHFDLTQFCGFFPSARGSLIRMRNSFNLRTVFAFGTIPFLFSFFFLF